MKTKILKITLVLLVIVSTLNAQENKQVHLKMIKDINGEKTIVDTIIEGNEMGGYSFYPMYDEGKLNVDSILKDLQIVDKKGMKVINLTAKDLKVNSGEKVLLTVTADDENKDHVVVKMKDGKIWTESNDAITIIGDDSVKVVKEIIINSGDEDMIFKRKEGEKVIIKTKSDDTYTWTIDSTGVKVMEITEEFETDHSIDKKFNVYISSDDQVAVDAISKIVVKDGEADCKTIKLIIEDDEDGNVKVVDLQNDLEDVAENVKITKRITDDGHIFITAEISECELTNDEMEKAKDIGLDNKDNLQLNKFKIFPNPTDGLFNIEFDLDDKVKTLVQVYNEEGKMVYSDKVKNFDGIYSNEIDLSKEDNGLYFIQIIQGKKSITKKIIKR